MILDNKTYLSRKWILDDKNVFIVCDAEGKLNEWIKLLKNTLKGHHYSIGQSTVIQELDKKRPTLSNLNQTQNRRRYVNFENGSHFICSFNLNNPELTVFIVFKMTHLASGDQETINSLISNNNKKVNAKFITF